MKGEIFLDTAYAIALAAVTDRLHERAVALAEEIESARPRIITTQAVLLEIGNALSKARYRAAALQLLASLDSDPNVTIIPHSSELHAKAVALFRSRMDKEWGLIDCVSFIVMQERGIAEALSHDEHFEQAGFIALLRKATS